MNFITSPVKTRIHLFFMDAINLSEACRAFILSKWIYSTLHGDGTNQLATFLFQIFDQRRSLQSITVITHSFSAR